MKKLLLLAGMFCFMFFGNNINAQTLYSQNFEVSQSSTPPGWNLCYASYHPKNPGWTFSNAWPVHGNSLWQYFTATHTYVAFVDDVDYDYTSANWSNNTPTNNYDSLKTGSFSCTGHASVFISFDMCFNNYTGSETGTIAYSLNGGLTWLTAVTLPVLGGDVSWHDGTVYDLSTYIGNQPNVMLAFCWNNTGAVSQGYCGWGMALDNISVYAPPAYDIVPTSTTTSYLLKTGNSASFAGTLYNWGGTAVTDLKLHYSVNNGPVKTDHVTGIAGFSSLTSYNFNHSVAWTPAASGNFKVKIWVDSLNVTNANGAPNDTIYAYYTVVDTVQTKTVLLEEFMQASCNPCMYAAPNLNGVITAESSILNPVRYHVSWPGVDYMNKETWIPQDSNRTFNYYHVNGVPDARIDGSTDVSPSTIANSDITNAQAMGSPFKITITQCLYNTITHNFHVTASVKSYGAFPEATTFMSILTVDTIKYHQNQSDEDPNSSFAPPIGTGTNPDSYYPYVMNFPNVVEDLMPNENGTALTPFSVGQTQTVNLNWTKNHPWGIWHTSFPYDSLGCHITVAVQENTTAAMTGAPAHSMSGSFPQYVYQSASAVVTNVTGFEEIATGTYFEMYPNPANNTTNVAFSLDKEQQVSVHIYNMLGEDVYSVDNGSMSAGQHNIEINSSGLQSGVYIVRFNTDNASTTKKLVIQR